MESPIPTPTQGCSRNVFQALSALAARSRAENSSVSRPHVMIPRARSTIQAKGSGLIAKITRVERVRLRANAARWRRLTVRAAVPISPSRAIAPPSENVPRNIKKETADASQDQTRPLQE